MVWRRGFDLLIGLAFLRFFRLLILLLSVQLSWSSDDYSNLGNRKVLYWSVEPYKLLTMLDSVLLTKLFTEIDWPNSYKLFPSFVDELEWVHSSRIHSSNDHLSDFFFDLMRVLGLSFNVYQLASLTIRQCELQKARFTVWQPSWIKSAKSHFFFSRVEISFSWPFKIWRVLENRTFLD